MGAHAGHLYIERQYMFYLGSLILEGPTTQLTELSDNSVPSSNSITQVVLLLWVICAYLVVFKTSVLI